ncbi:MAG: amidohydrolase family protein [Acidimicrobiales bacterium]
MFDGVNVLDVHSHVSAPMGGVGYINMLMQAMNGVLPSPIDTPAAAQFGLDDEAFATSVGNHIAYINERQIDVQILGPRPFLMQGWMQDHLLPAWTRFVNDCIAKQCRMEPTRFLGAAQLPQNVHAPDASHLLEELERCVGEHGFVGVYVSPDPEGRRNGPGLNDRWWDPLYQRCEEGGLPVIVHGTNCLDPRILHVPHNYQLGFVVEQYLATQVLSHGDVFDRFPGLRVIVCHCGGALDRFIPSDPHLAQKDLSDNLFFDTCAHDIPFLRCAFEQRGVKRMVFGTEAPGSGRAPRPEGPGITGDDLVPVIGSFDFLSAEDKRAVFHDNPRRLFPRMATLV